METAPGWMDTRLSPQNIPDVTPRLSHAVLIVLVLMVATFVVRFGMDVILLASKGEMRDFAACFTAATVARAGGSFYDPQLGRPWFAELVLLFAAIVSLLFKNRRSEGFGSPARS